MASFYPSEGDMLPPIYLLNQKHPSYSSSEVDNGKAYVCQPSVSLSYSNFLYTRQLVESETVATRDEVYVPPTNGNGTHQIDRQMNIIAPRYTDGNTVVADTGLLSNESRQCHGLSLTLGSQESSLVQLHSDMNQFASSNYHPLLSSNVQPEVQMQQYLSFGFPGKSQDTVRFGAGNDVHNLINSKGSNFASSLHQASDFTGGVGASKYVKAAQDLLDELVSAHRATPKEKAQKFNALGQDGSTERDAVSNELQEPANNAPRDLSPSERHDLQNKVTKLLSMLDEVDRRYKQYCHQMQVVVSSFEMLAGYGAAHPYTALTLRRISRQFRCLRDAIKKQIQAAQNILGEQDVGPNGVGVLSRLRYVDQQLRQQKAIQQYGVMRQPWRPQRGLPETAVSVLRAWLFEHFLHPYPKDSEKLVLARQTGLTRSQVANWFINARVRLWKPMIEEMYKEEFGESKSSPEHATTNQEISAFDDREEEFQGRLMSPAVDGNSRMHSITLAPDMISSSQGNTCRATLTYDNDEAFPGNEVNFGLMHLQQQGKQVSQTIFPYHNASINTTADDKHLDLITNVTSMDQVSLALGLQNGDVDSKSLPDETQQKGIDSSSSSMPLDKLDYYYVDPVSNQHRFANANLLSDFVS